MPFGPLRHSGLLRAPHDAQTLSSSVVRGRRRRWSSSCVLAGRLRRLSSVGKVASHSLPIPGGKEGGSTGVACGREAITDGQESDALGTPVGDRLPILLDGLFALCGAG